MNISRVSVSSVPVSFLTNSLSNDNFGNFLQFIDFVKVLLYYLFLIVILLSLYDAFSYLEFIHFYFNHSMSTALQFFFLYFCHPLKGPNANINVFYF